MGAKIWEYDPGRSLETWPEEWASLIDNRAVEFRIDRAGPDGRRLVLDVTVNYLEDAELAFNYGCDVTQRVIAEEQVRESDAMYRRMVDMASEGIWGTDAEFRTTFVNQQMAAMLGVEPDEMVGRPYADFAFVEDASLLNARKRLS